MKVYDRKKPLISIHIPKCAGKSFQKVLSAWFGKNLFLHYHNEKRNPPPKKHRIYKIFSRASLRPGICIHGHFNRTRSNGAHDFYPEINQYITILRDPFQVYLSNYFYIKKQGGNSYRNGKPYDIAAADYNLGRYLREERKSFILNFFPPDISLNNYRQILEEKFIYIGIAEDLQDSVNQLAEKLGVSGLTVPMENVSARKEKIPDSAREEFIMNNPLEMAIYEYALERYKQ
jgi:hypothetical protein